jgi:hypothetical protein
MGIVLSQKAAVVRREAMKCFSKSCPAEGINASNCEAR